MFGFKKKEKRYTYDTDWLPINLFLGCTNSMKISAVYRCVNVIADSLAQLPLEPYQIVNGFKIKYTSHPTYRLLNEEPNGNMTKYTFLKLLVCDMLLNGNAYAYIERDSKGNAVHLHYIPSQSVTIIPPETLDDKIYYQVTGFKSAVEDCDMIHILNYTNDGINGISTINYAINALNLAADADSSASSFYKKGANCTGFLSVNSPVTKDRKQKIKDDWAQSVQSGIPVLDADLDFHSISINPVDSQLLETREYSVVEICRFFGVSPVKAFDLSKSSYNTIEQMQLAFLTDTLQPLLEKYEEEFKRKLYLPSEKDGIVVKFDIASLLRVDRQSLANYYQTLFNIGAITPNEIRRELNLPAIEDGDNAFIQVNMSTLKKITKDEENTEI